MTLHKAQRPLINPRLALTASLIYSGNPVVSETRQGCMLPLGVLVKKLILCSMLRHTGLNSEWALKLRIELQIDFSLEPAGVFWTVSLPASENLRSFMWI